MAHKYKKINEDDVMSLFEKFEVLTRAIVARELGCALHAAIREIDFLKDEKIIKRVRFGFSLASPKEDCKCLNSKPLMKCSSENGVSSYCGHCGKGIK
jgi:hypothetical protein